MKFLVKFLKAISLGHATVKIIKALQSEGVPISKLLSLASDGPNVNKTMFRLLYEKLPEIYGRPIVYLHMYSPYCAQWLWCRCQILRKSNPRACIGSTCLFKGSAARKEDLQSMQQTLHIEQYVFLWYVPTR